MSGRSAIIVPVALPADLREVRDRIDEMASLGVPPHVTVLFPFLAVDELSSDVHGALTGLAVAQRRFVAQFDEVQCRPQMIWLIPTDQSPFLRLTNEVAARWPDHPPYGGVHDELIAHLTLAETADVRALEEVCAAASRSRGFAASANELAVLTEDAHRRWHVRWRFGFGRPGNPA